jgi:hypothetical protein
MAAHKEGLTKKSYKSWLGFLSKYGAETYYVMLVFAYAACVWVPHNLAEAKLAGILLLLLVPFVLPVLLGKMWVIAWFDYKRQQMYWDDPSFETTVLEIRIPEDITQGPQAAEMFIRVLYQTGAIEKPIDAWKGKTSIWFSLEIASLEGRVKFFVWTRKKFVTIIKAQMYAHYPTVQVVEVPDYTREIPYEEGKVKLMAIEQRLQKPDPYPIMTYLAWKLDKNDTKEEFKTDPLNSVLEFFGTMGPGEYAWMQIILEAHDGPDALCPWAHADPKFHIAGLSETANIEDWAKAEINELGKKYSDKKNAEDEKVPVFMSMSKIEEESVKAIQEKLNKQLFNVGIRNFYIARTENFDPSKPAGVPTAMRSFEHGSSGRGLNGLRPMFYVGPFLYPWQDFFGIRKSRLNKKIYQAYVERQFFWEPHKQNHIVLNLEEIATLWHLPGKVAHTPTLERMPSRRSEAPANLPI